MYRSEVSETPPAVEKPMTNAVGTNATSAARAMRAAEPWAEPLLLCFMLPSGIGCPFGTLKQVGVQDALIPFGAMADYREIIHERLYLRVPGTDKLRKTAAARLKHLLANGWREVNRQQQADHVRVRLERTGHAPLATRLPRHEKERPERRRPREGGFGPRR